jgi:hypothetical protein
MKIFNNKHLKVLLVLFLVDIIATITWFSAYGVEEANPVLSGVINNSILLFCITKILLSFPALIILDKYLHKKITQVAIGMSLFLYSIVAVMHYSIFMFFFIASI